MDFHQFIGNIQNRARLSSEDQALKAARATLQTLSERLGENEPQHLLSQLPEEIRSQVPKPEGTESFGVDEFFKKVSEREGVDIHDAAFHSRAVISTICEAVSRGQVDHLRNQLSPDFSVLFEEVKPETGNTDSQRS